MEQCYGALRCGAGRILKDSWAMPEVGDEIRGDDGGGAGAKKVGEGDDGAEAGLGWVCKLTY